MRLRSHALPLAALLPLPLFGVHPPKPASTPAGPRCEALLSIEEVAKACKLDGLTRAPAAPSDDAPPELDVGVCATRFVDKFGREVRFSLDRSSSVDENHHAAEETLRTHGADPGFTSAGLAPTLGAAWTENKNTRAAMFVDDWHLDFTAAPAAKNKKGQTNPCAPSALGSLALTASARLPH